MSKRAEEAALKMYPVIKEEHSERDINKATRRACMRGYEQAEKYLLPLINRLCEAILMDWENKADVARETLTKLKEYE